jgi:hypothetical protein
MVGSHLDNSTKTVCFSSSVSAEAGSSELNGTPIFSYGTAKSMYVSFRNQNLVARTAGLLNVLEPGVVSLLIIDGGCGPRLMLFSEEEPDGGRRR